MGLTEEEDERLTLILQGLEPEIPNLYNSAQSFVLDQIDRHKKYGSEIRVSPKQWKWLEDLYQQFVGDEAEPVRGVDGKTDRNTDIDDEIPF